MSGSRYFDRVAAAVTALTLVLTVLLMNGEAFGLTAAERTMGYEARLFDNANVHAVEITMDNWDDLIANAAEEEYYAADVVIDGEHYKNVGIRAKGNTSLSTVSQLGSERYSFKIEFDHYEKGKTYHGLDKLCLNNLIQDSTMMKDYLTYTMMNAFGANAPLCSYVYITVNGEAWGLYLAVEGVEEAFLERNYGANYGQLYKPDSISFGGGPGGGEKPDREKFDFDEQNGANADGGAPFDREAFPFPQGDGGFDAPGEWNPADMPEGFDPAALPGGGERDFPGGFGMGSSDVKLQYIDDDLESYSNIWNSAKTDSTDADQKRLIESLRKLSEREEIDSVVDVDQVMRYFVVHNYVCNGDSYTGSMIHNYYLYEKDGKLSMLPWDYNLAFGTFQGGDASGTVNTPIDAPIEGGDGEDRPMWYWIAADEEYTALYHRYFAEFLDTVDIAAMIDHAYEQIKAYVAKDPTAFYSPEEFEQGVETLRQFCSLRSESISLQLESGETSEDMGYADASSITLSDMGTMGGGKGGFGEGMPGRDEGKGGFGGAGDGNAPHFDAPAAEKNGAPAASPPERAESGTNRKARRDAIESSAPSSAH